MKRDLLSLGFRMAQRSHLANLKGLSDEEGAQLLGIEGNSINWIAGHVLASRDRLLLRLGGAAFLTRDEGASYATGSSPKAAQPPPVGLTRIIEGLTATGDFLSAKLRTLSDGDLEAGVDPKTVRVPLDPATLGSLLSFFVYHEGYHSGQLGLARRVLGKPSGLGF
jgi:uncharacterized damage-inducible protein DinB